MLSLKRDHERQLATVRGPLEAQIAACKAQIQGLTDSLRGVRDPAVAAEVQSMRQELADARAGQET
jgi:hypothetical protein